jgi:putative transposase
MSNYRRLRVPGGLYFFTVVTASRRPLLIEHIHALRQAFRAVRETYPYQMDAVVILPDHLHCIWELPDGDSDFPTRWRLIKSRFSNSSPAAAGVGKGRLGERAIWQRRYWEHLIRDERDYARHLDYIHYNPVKHGYVTKPAEWAYSSFRKFVEAGVYQENWGQNSGVDDMNVE